MSSNDETLDTRPALDLVRSALHPDERKFMKEYLGQEEPGLSDYLLPSTKGMNRFTAARAFREEIIRSVLLQSGQLGPRATVGEAQDIFPGFPTPRNAQTPGVMQPGGELPGPGAPVPAGPAPNQAPIPQLAPHDVPAILPGTQSPSFTGNYNVGPDQSGWEPKQGMPFQGQITPGAMGSVQEGPRPTAPPTTGPSGVDPNALLPVPYQKQFDARTHRESLRGLYGGRQGTTMQLNDHYAALKSKAIEEAYPGETEHVERLLVNTRTAPAGSSEAAIKGNQATITGAQAAVAPQQAQATLDKTVAGTENLQAKTNETNTLINAKLNALIARSKLDETRGGQTGQALFNAEQRIKIMEAGKDLELFKILDNRSMLDDVGKQNLLKGIVGRVANELELSGENPSWLQHLLRITPSGVKVTPKGAAPGTSKSQSFEGAPAGKAVGAILKDESGKAVATWDGKAWQAIK